MHLNTIRFCILFTQFLSFLTTISSQTADPTPYPTPNPTTNPVTTPRPTPNPTTNPVPSPTQSPLVHCCDCTTPSQSHGCPHDQLCESQICISNPLCCDTNNGWDQTCAATAMISCEAPLNACCQCTTATPTTNGCNADPQCQSNICDINIDCCIDGWAQSCAALAQTICAINYDSTMTTTTTTVQPIPTDFPTMIPTIDPTMAPSDFPTQDPITASVKPTQRPSDKPTNSPSVKPTRAPSQLELPNVCNDRCDAFSVRVMDYELFANNVTITYKVQRLFSEGLCKKSIKYIVLGLCDNAISHEVTDNDLNGLINDFEIIENGYQRRLVSSSSDSDSDEFDEGYRMVWGSNSEGEMTGIHINIGIDEQLQFRINLRNVFIDTPQLLFAENVRLARGTKEFECNGLKYVLGLPCLDGDKFVIGGYSDMGYNKQTKKIDIVSAVNEDKASDNTSNWGVLSELDPYIRYSLISLFAVFVALMWIMCAYVYRAKHRTESERVRTMSKEEMKRGTHMKVKTNDNVFLGADLKRANEKSIPSFMSLTVKSEEMEDHSLVRFTSNN